MQTIYLPSVEYATATVAVKVDGAWQDVSALTVQMAFKISGVEPVAGDWVTATWKTNATTTPAEYTAVSLIGTGGTVLAAGRYLKWIKLFDTPETPVFPAGELLIT